jgi:asparagine synthetase B (glutamine-hydrolysing)
MNIARGHFSGSFMLGAPKEAVPRLDIYFRGYLANQSELARQTGLEASEGRSPIDVISRCYERWGRTLPTRLEGQFALVVADRVTGDILLSHDSLGVVPLYWSARPGLVRFSTTLRDLVDVEACGRLNFKEVRRYIHFGGAATEETVYATIKRLEPGTSIWISNGAISRDVSWDPRKLEPIVYSRSEQYVDHFVDLVDKSVQGALHDCGKAWISLSGGLDSNTLLPPALKYCPGLKAFSVIAPQWPDIDESRWIERIVARRGLAWHAVNAEDVLPFGELPHEFSGGPDSGPINQRLNSLLNELVGENVLLTGDGGDSFMGARMGPAPSHLADPIFTGKVAGLFGNLLPWIEQSKPERPKAHWVLHALILPSLRHLLRRNVRPPFHLHHPQWLRTSAGLRFSSRALQSRAVAPHCQTPGQQAILDDLWKCAEDRPASDASYASRHPLFYRPLFEFMWAIPWSQKQLPRCDRYLQRRALKGLVDDDIRTRIGYGSGSRLFVEGLQRSKQWQEYLCDSPKLAERGLMDAAKWQLAIQQACVGQTHAEPLLLRAMSVEIWLKQLSQFRPSRFPVPERTQVELQARSAWSPAR